MSRVRKTVRAESDIEDLWLYIATDNPQAADRILDDIEAQCRLIATQPNMGRLRSELTPGLRSFPVGRYIILYQTLPDGIEVVRVLHSARDLDALL
ncbi:MAG: type II toxin-antitoxin system RelE/ParE family toxin [Alphaproteobacteria bacterium]|jgi:toxin ParE1/3/4